MAIRSASRDVGIRTSFNEPSTDEQPRPFRSPSVGPVAGSRIYTDFLGVLDRNQTDPRLLIFDGNRMDPRPVVKCRHCQIVLVPTLWSR